MRLFRRISPSIATLGFALTTLTGCPEQAKMELTMLCKSGPKTSAPNGVSFVFKAEDENGEPITDLELFKSKFKVEDGGVTSGGESTPDAIQRPQNVARRTLVLIDGSGSVAQNPENEANIKRAITKFLIGCEAPFNNNGVLVCVDGVAEDAPANDPRHVVGIYAFYGNNELVEIYGFSTERDQTLSLSYNGGDEAKLKSAWLNDRKAMLDKLEATQIARPQTSTALHAASKLALAKLDAQPAWVPNDAYKPAVVTKSLVLFTDGRDEVNAGSSYESTREDALMRADSFKYLSDGKVNGTHSILVAGVRGTGNTLDADFLQDFASEGSYSEVAQFENLSDEFDKFSEKSARAVRKYYQFNLCSNRRGSYVDATLVTPHDGYEDGKVEFGYNASTFTDPTSTSMCEASTLQTCDWQDSGSTVSGSGSTDPVPNGWTRTYTFLESLHPYANNSESSKPFSFPGASQLILHFSRIETESGHDYVTVYDDSGFSTADITGSYTNYQVQVYSGSGQIVLSSDGSNNGYGYRVDYVDAKYGF